MAKLTSLNFLMSPYPPMNKEVTSFLFPFSLIEMFLRSTIFYYKIEEKAQICQMPPARAPRILCCTWSIYMCSVSGGLRRAAWFISMFPCLWWAQSGCSLNAVEWIMNKCLSPSFQELGLQGPHCYSKESAASKTYNSFVQAAGLSPWEVYTQVCKTTIWLS